MIAAGGRGDGDGGGGGGRGGGDGGASTEPSLTLTLLPPPLPEGSHTLLIWVAIAPFDVRASSTKDDSVVPSAVTVVVAESDVV